MRRKFGILFMLMGAALILGSVGLLLHNRQEDRQAGAFVEELMPSLHDEIQAVRQTVPCETMVMTDNIPEELLTEEDLIMTEKIIKGYPYIGYLSIPELNLELPVMSDWNMNRLKIAPCRYSGTLRGGDLVLLAHSYPSHFGKISSLTEGSEVLFMDMDGNQWEYAVAATDILDAYAVEEMTSGEYDLTLFTCTPNSTHRVTIRCDRIKTGG